MSLYLTKMILNPHSRRVQFEIGNPQELHKTVSNAFPQIEGQEHLPHHERETPRNQFDILYRLDVDRRAGKIVLLVQSAAEPDWRNLREHFLAEDAENNLAVKEIGANYARIENGMNLLFRLQANPTKRVGEKYQHPNEKKREAFTEKFRDEKKRRRISINDDAGRIEWLRRKGEAAGFKLTRIQVKEIENAVAVGQGKITFSKKGNSSELTFGSVIFDGVLDVTDAEKLRQALQKGIGTGKAYGFGLLSVAKVQDG